MYPLTHLFVSQTVLDKENVYTILGAVFPDLYNLFGVSHDEGHALSQKLYDFCAAGDYGEYALDFARSALTHEKLDVYADESYDGQKSGYCFQVGACIAPRLADLCGFPLPQAQWKAHNFIETGFDLVTLERNPDLGKAMTAFLPRLETHFKVDFLADYFRKDAAPIQTALGSVFRMLCFEEMETRDIIDNFVAQLQKDCSRSINPDAAADLVLEAKELASRGYDAFIKKVIPEIHKDIQQLSQTI